MKKEHTVAIRPQFRRDKKSGTINLFAGRIKVAAYHTTAMRSKDDPRKWKVSSFIPGVRIRKDGRFADEEDARAACEILFDHYLKSLGDELD